MITMPTFFRVLASLCLLVPFAAAGGPRVLPAGKRPDDQRLGPLRDLDGFFPFTPPASRSEWEARAAAVRRQMQVALGLWPMPTRTPLSPVIHGKIDRDDYTVEKVYFESMPGLLVTGNLYRPKGRSGKLPALLSPHGHWQDGRFTDAGAERVQRDIAAGAERFAEGGRSPLQALCVQLARMGCIVFHYDMLGNADSVQIPLAVTHDYARQRSAMNTLENWGLYSAQAEAHLQSVMGLQTWNSIRALDFLLGLPEVDATRVGCAGASGGGTQTFVLGALDPRLALAFPAVMVSTAMQGGCPCENASLLRIGTGNVEFAALFAPRPLGMTSANDWTRELATKGFPELKQLYTLLGAPDHVTLVRGEQFDHNLNAVSRAAVYECVNRNFKLLLATPIEVRDYQRLTRDEMSVWDAEHPAPKAGDPEFERALLRWWHEDAQRQLHADLQRCREISRGALEVMIGRTLADAGVVTVNADEPSIVSTPDETDHGAWLQTQKLIRNRTYHEALPAVFCSPKQPCGTTTLWLSARGKSALFDQDGTLAAGPRQLVDHGITVVGVDLFQQGEFLPDGKPFEHTDRVANERDAPAYTFGYNRALFAQRVHDVLSAVKLLRQPACRRLDVVGLDGAGPWVAAARALSDAAIDHAVIDTDGFRFAHVLDVQSPDFLPGGAKYGDVPGMLALGAPGPLLLAGEDAAGLALVRSHYRAMAAAGALTESASSQALLHQAAVDWLLGAP